MEDEMEDFLPGYKNVEEFSQKACKAMVAASRAFQALPPAGSPIWDLRKSYPEFNRGLKVNRNRLISTMMNLLKHSNIPPDDFKRRDVEEKFEFIVDANDDMLERIATSLDKAEGLFKRAEILVVNSVVSHPKDQVVKEKLPAPHQSASTKKVSSKTTNVRKIKKAFFRNKVKEKPQIKFSTPVDNSLSPFVPNLQYKPHALKPLSILPEYTVNEEEFYGHPYTVELNRWEPKPFMLARAEPNFPTPLDETRFMLVETTEQLKSMLSELKDVKEIAVDLEHHSYRSFLGITCLMQISTRTHDFVVDTLALRDEMHHLNEVFTNPNILKVFHGATSDIPWLQKDFSVYVVGMFDTAIAAQALKFPSISLQYLLNSLCETTTDKSFQLADWRIRPLPEEMVQYARMDTHLLLHIYDLLKNKLLDEPSDINLLDFVYEQSRQGCLKRYEKPTNNPQVALRKVKRPLNNRQLHGFIELFKWRDRIARQKDESLGYVLPNHMLLTISETLPKEMTGILSCCDPVPALVSQNLSVIHQIITEARDLPMHFQETSIHHKADKKSKQNNWMIMMDSIHEVSVKENESEACKLLKTGAGEWWSSIDYSDVKIRQSPSVLFEVGSCVGANTASAETKLSPYHRYKLTTEIIRNLKDPKKKSQVDVENPLIKSVAVTILAEANNEKEQGRYEPPKPARKSGLMNQDFVPFNPMAVSQTNNSRKRKSGSTDNNCASKEEADHDADASGDNVEVPEYSAAEGPGMIKGKSKKQRRNIIKKLASRGRKRRYELEHGEQDVEEGEIVDTSTKTPSTSPKKTKKNNCMKNYISLDSNNAISNKNHSSSRGTQKESPKDQGKNKKKGFWGFRAKGEGKSITFK